MNTIHKTDTGMSPLLQPVVQRSYTAGFNFDAPAPGAGAGPEPPTPPGQQAAKEPGQQQQQQQQQQNFSRPAEDTTKTFEFDEGTSPASDLTDDNDSAGIKMPPGSAKAFANFVGSAIQQYLPKATYAYAKIEMESVKVNVEKGNLTLNWIDVFTEMNKSAEEGLKISDESIKMWKSAFKDWLEYNNIAAANPNTALIMATLLLLADQGVKTYQIKKSLQKCMIEALEASNPGKFSKKMNIPEDKKTDTKTEENEARRA